MSNDRDLCQLIDDNVSVYVINLKRIVTKENYLKHFNHLPSNLKLIKIISGDTSDNIKGIKGISEKTLLTFFRTLLITANKVIKSIILMKPS